MFSKKMKKLYYSTGVAFTMGQLAVTSDAEAANTFSSMAENANTSIFEVPALLSAVSYLGGIVLAVGGGIKLKGYVDNPMQVQAKEIAARWVPAAFLLVLPYLFEILDTTLLGADTATGDVQDSMYGSDFTPL